MAGKLSREDAQTYREVLDKANWEHFKIALRADAPVNTLSHISAILRDKLRGFEIGFFTEADIIQRGLRTLGWVPISEKTWKREVDPNGTMTQTDMEMSGLSFTTSGYLRFKDLVVMVRPLEVAEKVRNELRDAHVRSLKGAVKGREKTLDPRSAPESEYVIGDDLRKA